LTGEKLVVAVENDQNFNDATVETAARSPIEWWLSLLYVTINNFDENIDGIKLDNIVMIMMTLI
jgi:hypothetical protein